MPDRLSPGSTRTAPSTMHWGGGEKWATDAQQGKLRTRDNIIIGTWNVRTLNGTGKLEELTYEMSKYRWNILGLCEVRWKQFGETSTADEHKIYYSGREDKHEHGVGFLVHKDNVNHVMSCNPISSRLITIRLRASPFNITIIQAYAPTSDYEDKDIESFYDHRILWKKHQKKIF